MLLPVQAVGVQGDARTYENVIAIRAVETEDFMTADWSRLPHDLLARISTRITNEVKGVNRVVSTSPASRRGRSSGSRGNDLFARLRATNSAGAPVRWAGRWGQSV